MKTELPVSNIHQDTLTKTSYLSVVLVWDENSGDSYLMKLIFDRLAKQHERQVEFQLFNATEFHDRHEEWLSTRKLPTILILKLDQPSHIFEGLIPKSVLEEYLLEEIAQAPKA
ncbi:MAG: hypothetical protein AAGI49_12330 [Bacteroidota bacterium]